MKKLWYSLNLIAVAYAMGIGAIYMWNEAVIWIICKYAPIPECASPPHLEAFLFSFIWPAYVMFLQSVGTLPWFTLPFLALLFGGCSYFVLRSWYRA